MADWSLSDEDLGRVELYPWSEEGAADFPFLVDAVADFEATSEKNHEAAEEATIWLQRQARQQKAAVTRLFVVDEHIVSFYALVSAEMQISSTQNLRNMGYFVPIAPPGKHRVGASHIESIARDRRAPGGAGKFAITHAFGVAAQVAALQGNRVLTLDPRDADTQEMWHDQGFHRTETQIGTTGLYRHYAPIFGAYYGGLPRPVASD